MLLIGQSSGGAKMLKAIFISLALCAVPLASQAQSSTAVGPQGTTVQTPAAPKEVHVDTKILAGYVGRYQVAPNVILTIRLNGDHLFAFAPGQQLAEMYASSEKDFFLEAADTKFTFVTNSQGKASEIVMHLQGQDQRAPRVEDASK
jgi:hypothetical protein